MVDVKSEKNRCALGLGWLFALFVSAFLLDKMLSCVFFSLFHTFLL